MSTPNDSIDMAMLDSEFDDVSDSIISGLSYMAVREAAAELSNMNDYRIRELPITQREIVEKDDEEWEEDVVWPAIDLVYFDSIDKLRKLFYDELVPAAIATILDNLEDAARFPREIE